MTATPAAERPRTATERLLEGIAAKLGDRLAAELKRGDVLRPSLTAAKLAAIAVAILVELLALGAVAGAIVLAVRRPGFITLVLAVPMLGFAWLIRPRLGRVPKEGRISRADAPELHAVATEVAASLNTRPPDLVVVDTTLNAYWNVSGLRRRRVLGLGVPLLAILEPQERVALVAHELAHARNGDVGRTLIVSSALRTLEEVYLTLTPGESTLTYSDVGVFEVVARGMMWLLAQPVKWLYVFELHLLLSDMQRAEYLADALAALVAGTAATTALHDKLLLEPVVSHTVHRAALDRIDSERLCSLLSDAVRAVPQRELDRRRRAAALEKTRLGATHPPTAMRIDLLESRPATQPRVVLDEERSTAIDAELDPWHRRAGRRLVEDYRGSLYN